MCSFYSTKITCFLLCINILFLFWTNMVRAPWRCWKCGQYSSAGHWLVVLPDKKDQWPRNVLVGIKKDFSFVFVKFSAHYLCLDQKGDAQPRSKVSLPCYRRITDNRGPWPKMVQEQFWSHFVKVKQLFQRKSLKLISKRRRCSCFEWPLIAGWKQLE